MAGTRIPSTCTTFVTSALGGKCVGRFLLKRILWGIAIIFVVSVGIFAILYWVPGNPAQLIVGVNASPQALHAIEVHLGLNRPWYVQYASWLVGALRGRFGESIVYGTSVVALIAQRLPVTITLAFMAMAITMAVTVPMSVIAAGRANSWLDKSIQGLFQVLLAMPSFWLGIVLLLFFGLKLGWFPVGGFPGFGAGLGQALGSLVLPALSLAGVEIAIIGRILRRAMLESLEAPFIQSAQSKGLSRRRQVWVHAFRNALIAPLTVMGLEMAGLLGGVTVIENVFSLPGVGRLLFIAVQQKDLPVVEGITLFFAVIVVVLSIVVDILYAALDPRITLS